MVLQPYDREALRAAFDAAQPFRHIVVDDFLAPAFAAEIAAAYPSFDEAREQGFEFDFVNERRKIQVTESSRFPEPVKRLHEALASDAFLADLRFITGIDGLQADPELAGGGMHVTGAHGRLDVHVDFNYVEERDLHRRLNILVYLNPEWKAEWGGAIELWDRDVKTLHHSIVPALGRMVLFETSEISFHGVSPLEGPEQVVRQSFAAYYYTAEAPAGWDGTKHNTIFRARPDERLRRYVLMPAEQLRRRSKRALIEARRRLKGG